MGAQTFEKWSFDLTKEQPIETYLAGLNRKQIVVAGCETDVCVLQSCLGLLNQGYEVYMVEDLLFHTSRNVEAALIRMKVEGAIFLSYKTLFYELGDAARASAAARPIPIDLPDTAS